MAESKTCTTYTVPRLAKRLGIHCHQVRYLVGTKRIPDGKVRPGSCRKVWNEGEASRIERWYRAYTRLGAGCCDEINREQPPGNARHNRGEVS